MRYQKLKEYIKSKKRSDQIHQLVIIKTILNNSGLSNQKDIAKELMFNNSQLLRDYSKIVRNTANRVLKKNKILNWNKKSEEYRLNSIEFYSNKQIQNLIDICEDKIDKISADNQVT